VSETINDIVDDHLDNIRAILDLAGIPDAMWLADRVQLAIDRLRTPHESAALDALVTWRKAVLEWQKCSRDPRGIGLTASLSDLNRVERIFLDSADALIAKKDASTAHQTALRDRSEVGMTLDRGEG
jgi:hypothetical protein